MSRLSVGAIRKVDPLRVPVPADGVDRRQHHSEIGGGETRAQNHHGAVANRWIAGFAKADRARFRRWPGAGLDRSSAGGS